MAKHTQHFTAKIKSHISSDKGQRKKSQWTKQHATLPDALKLAVIRGEALYRQRLFAYFASKGFDDRFAYQAYQTMYVDSHMIVEFVQHIGLQEVTEDYIKHGLSGNNTSHHQQCYQLYCLLVDYLSQLGDEMMLNNATIGLIQHYLPSYFPTANTIKPSIDDLQKQLKKALNTLWHCQVTVKESFTTDEQSATMKLIAHVNGYYPLELACITEKRLRSAKFKAYHQLLADIQSGEFALSPISKTAKSNQPIKPF